MKTLAEIPINDLRSQLAVQPAASRRNRYLPIIGATVHYNGAVLPFIPHPEKELHFVSTVDVREHQKRLKADSIQYHFVVLSNGAIYQTRDINLIAWHCGNAIGNEQSIAVHLPLGKGQRPQEEQWKATVTLLDALGHAYGFTRDAVVGHNEWPRGYGKARPSATYRVLPHQSECPGELIHQRIVAYRQEKMREAPKTTETWVALWKAPIRQAPRVTFENGNEVPIAGWLSPGEAFEVDLIKTDGDAQEIRGDKRWLHLANGLGFVWLPNARRKIDAPHEE